LSPQVKQGRASELECETVRGFSTSLSCIRIPEGGPKPMEGYIYDESRVKFIIATVFVVVIMAFMVGLNIGAIAEEVRELVKYPSS
jgi:hypothetical protein